ncbi:intraflagellar transport protein 81 homolog isoform X1 [Homarus americanus]|uniref:intraflagellar transport protein 81 homolog isoform X1 n=1 Tax=Homarus americanus TaxID=6706 RepID=UPI001C43C97E|nr:intraflagellar transport protein 81 homolog isoform X1 [Homarus americanus]XP_042242431.1 intraflagellar transport protein 81 homolog isoform X1 [Homarus americanus]
MSEEIKFIVNELNKEPYSRNYNLISFDALNGESLLQILNDVFAEIDGKNKLDIREEEPEQMAVRMLGMLRILKYKPPDDNIMSRNPANMTSNFRQGLVSGNKQVIYPILAWLLERTDELKKRAYLAKYLVKLEVPAEIIGDVDVADTHMKYEELIDQFKSIHREYEALRTSGFSTAELRRDIAAMEEERDLVLRRIDRMKQKIEGTPNSEAMLSSARALRQEKERKKEMGQQEGDLKSAIQLSEQRIARLQTQLKDIRKAGMGTTPEGLLQRLEEDVNVNTYIVKEKLPKELSAKERYVAILERVAAQPAMGQQEIDSVNKQIRALTTEINKLNEARMKEVDEDDTPESKVGKLSFFRKNTVIIGRKKEQTAERLNELRGELANIQEDMRDKQDQLKKFSGEQVLRGEEFKRYVNKLRGKSSVYKIKRAELSDLRAEYGVLSRTEEILKSKDAQILEQLNSVESQMGVSGFRETQETMEKVSTMKAEIDERKGQTLEEMSGMVIELNHKIAERKARLAPIIKELRPLRQKVQDLTVDYNDKKHTHDSVAAGLDTNLAKLETEVKNLYDEIVSSETKYHILNSEREILNLKQQQASDEIKLYLSSDPQDKRKSLREQLMTNISEQEKLGRVLREEQKSVKDLLQTSAKQLRMWQDVVKLMEVKRKCLDAARNSGNVTRNSGGEALVLT